MNIFERSLVFAAVLLAGCGTTRNVAVTSYHVTRGAAVGSYKVARAVAVGSYRVASAPVHYATRRRGSESSVATETVPSDVTNPGQTVPPEMASAAQEQSRGDVESYRGQRRISSGGDQRAKHRETTQSSTGTSSSPTSAPTTSSFPTGKPVPGKPGYVFSPFDASDRYVDVSGFAPGTKVKDPWTDKIFIVP
jgi:hypothetical protein